VALVGRAHAVLGRCGALAGLCGLREAGRCGVCQLDESDTWASGVEFRLGVWAGLDPSYCRVGYR